MDITDVCPEFCVCRMCLSDEIHRLQACEAVEAENYARLNPAARVALDTVKREVAAQFRGPDEFSPPSRRYQSLF